MHWTIRGRSGRSSCILRNGSWSNATRLALAYADNDAKPFDVTIVDEAQDISIAQLRFLAALGGKRPDGLLVTSVEPASKFLDDFRMYTSRGQL